MLLESENNIKNLYSPQNEYKVRKKNADIAAIDKCAIAITESLVFF